MSMLYFTYDPTTEFDRLFEDAFATRFCPRMTCIPSNVETKRGVSARKVYRPRLDLQESEETNTITATFELPGFTSNDVTIDIQQNRLTVSGGSESSSDAQEDGRYVVRERRAGKFSRTLVLPLGVKSEDVKAKMEDGILTITFPKSTLEQQATRITIQ